MSQKWVCDGTRRSGTGKNPDQKRFRRSFGHRDGRGNGIRTGKSGAELLFTDFKKSWRREMEE